MNSEAAFSPARRTLWALCLALPLKVVCTDAWMANRAMVSRRQHFGGSKSSFHSCSIPRTTANIRRRRIQLYESSSETPRTEKTNVKISELNDMDVVVYSLLDEDKLCLGAIQEGGLLSPLSAWTDEPAFGDSIEFLVDEQDRFSLEQETKDQLEMDSNASDTAKHTIRIHHLLSDDEVSYGQRQCPRGVHNPHGEESEMLYYVEQQLIDEFQIEMELKPELETLW